MKIGELNALIKLDGKSQFDRDLDGAGRKLGSLGDTALRAGQSMATIGVAAGTAMLGLTAAVFKTGVEYNALQQSSRAALTTLLGSAEAANAQMDKLDDFASNSPFAKDVFIRAQQQMIGFGIAAEDVIPILGAVQDATAAVGGSNQDISDIVTTLSKISSTGKITAQDLNELGNKGIDAASLMGAEFGKTSAEIRADITKGKISAEDAINAITNQMSVKFGGAAANVKKTWDGATDRVKAAWRDIGSELAAPFVDPNGGGRAIQWVNDLADVMRALQKQIAPLMDIVMTRWAGQFDKITPYLQDLKDRIDSLDMSTLNEGLDALDGYGPIIAGLAGAFTAWGTATLPIIGGINPIVAGVTALVLATPELRDGLNRVLIAAMPLVTEFGELGVQIADIAVKVLTEFAPAFFDLAEAVVNAAVPLGGVMVDGISALLTLMDPFIDLLSGVVSWMSKLPDGVLLAGAAFMTLKGHSGALKAGFETLAIQGLLVGDSLRSMKPGIVAGGMSSLATMTSKAGAALKSAFITNAPALAIAAVVAVLGKMASESARNKQEVRALASSFDELGEATDATREQLVEMMRADENWAGLGDNLEDRLNAVGISTREVTDALMEGGQAVTDLQERLRDMADAAEAAGNSRRASEMRDMADAIGKMADEYDGAADSARKNADASEQAARASRDEKSAIEELIDAQKRQQDQLLGVSNSALAAREAQRSYNDAVESAASVIADETASYSQKEAALDAMARAVQRNVVAAQENGASQEELNAMVAQGKEAFIGLADQTNFTTAELEALWAEIGLAPDVVVSRVEVDTRQAWTEINGLKVGIDETTGLVTIDGNPVPAETTLAEVEGAIDNGDGTVTIDGDKRPADMTLDDYLFEIARSSGAVEIDGDPHKADEALSKTLNAIRRGEENVKIGGKTYKADDALAQILARIWGSSASVAVNSYVQSYEGINLVRIEAQKGARMPIYTYQVGDVGRGARASSFADGAVVDYYAHGGVRENHVAQIAPAGAWRVWAEPETGGEAYIPLALAKRSRSEQILAEVADRFGMMLMPASAHQFATGGMHTAPPAPSRAASRVDSGLPRHVVLQIGDREISGLIREVAGEHPGVKAANGLVSNMGRYRAQMGV